MTRRFAAGPAQVQGYANQRQLEFHRLVILVKPGGRGVGLDTEDELGTSKLRSTPAARSETMHGSSQPDSTSRVKVVEACDIMPEGAWHAAGTDAIMPEGHIEQWQPSADRQLRRGREKRVVAAHLLVHTVPHAVVPALHRGQRLRGRRSALPVIITAKNRPRA